MTENIFRVESLDDARVALYTEYNEPQLLHYNEPNGGIFIAETPMVIARAMELGMRPVSMLVEQGALAAEAMQQILSAVPEETTVLTAELPVINKITGFTLTRGVLAAFERPKLPAPADILRSAECVAVMENVVNPTNLGAIFRSAAALGVNAILITRGSTDPYYRRASRVSMGTVFQIPWTYFPEEGNYVDTLHEAGFTVISMALVDRAIPLTDPVLKTVGRRAIVFGTEGTGICGETLAASDYIAIIPMQRGVDSLNVAASSAVAFWELCSKTTGGENNV